MQAVNVHVLVVQLLAKLVCTFVGRHLIDHEIVSNSDPDIIEHSVEGDGLEGRSKNIVGKITSVA